jgi:uncharacterized membrane protein YhhN
VIFVVPTAAAVGWLVWAERAGSPTRPAAKTLASLGFLAVALTAGALGSGLGRLLFAGLVLGAIGDVALLGRGSAPFLAGLSAFLLGHLAYAAAFLTASRSWLVAAGAAVAVTTVVAVWRWMGPHLPPGMRVPVAAYVLVIGLMLATGIGVVTVMPLAAAGAVLFTVSDVAVARDRFVDPDARSEWWGLPVYYAAQVLIGLAAGAV